MPSASESEKTQQQDASSSISTSPDELGVDLVTGMRQAFSAEMTALGCVKVDGVWVKAPAK